MRKFHTQADCSRRLCREVDRFSKESMLSLPVVSSPLLRFRSGSHASHLRDLPRASALSLTPAEASISRFRSGRAKSSSLTSVRSCPGPVFYLPGRNRDCDGRSCDNYAFSCVSFLSLWLPSLLSTPCISSTGGLQNKARTQAIRDMYGPPSLSACSSLQLPSPSYSSCR